MWRDGLPIVQVDFKSEQKLLDFQGRSRTHEEMIRTWRLTIAPTLLLEPAGRNTAPAICVAALSALERDANALLLVLPADHVIRDIAAFHAAIEVARAAAQDGALVTFGIRPTHAETGFGYIKAKLAPGATIGSLERFVEKPDAATAARFIESGDYLWNSEIGRAHV